MGSDQLYFLFNKSFYWKRWGEGGGVGERVGGGVGEGIGGGVGGGVEKV